MDKARHNAKDGLLIVEGYFDVLQLQKLNIYQAVAPMGTALTEDHLKALKRYTNRLVFVLTEMMREEKRCTLL